MSVVSRGIFLSYRHEDAASYARLLQFQMRERFPGVHIFMDLDLDLDSGETGSDFADVIRETVDSCSVLVALIGRQWATIADEQGRRRLDLPRIFRTADLWLIHAADCCSRYSSWTCCGVRY